MLRQAQMTPLKNNVNMMWLRLRFLYIDGLYFVL